MYTSILLASAVVSLSALLTGAKLPEGTQLEKVLFPENKQGAHCLDGSPSGYYISPLSESTDPDTWVIWLQGGGSCQSEADCETRATTDLGSSKNWPTTLGEEDLTDADCSRNPSLCNASMVYVPYCSGDVHTGNRTGTSNESFGLYFNGYTSFVHIISQLKTTRNLSSAKRVLLTGTSAGGIGVFNLVDFLAEMLPDSTVRGAPNAGWFLPNATADDGWQAKSGQDPPSDWPHWSTGRHGNAQANFSSGATSDLWHPITHPKCVAGQIAAGKNPLLCGSQHVLYPYIESPLYVVENKYDTFQLFNIMLLPQTPANSSMRDAYVAMFGDAMIQSAAAQVLNLPEKANDGIFLPACASHVVSTNELFAGSGMKTYVELVGDWFMDEGKYVQYYRQVESCDTSFHGLPCNPSKGCLSSPSPSPSPSRSSGCVYIECISLVVYLCACTLYIAF